MTISYWCYGLEHLDRISGYLANKSLNERTPQEPLLGKTPDISVFRFHWFQPIWYNSPDTSFQEDKIMFPGFFLGVAPNVGNGFSYHILPSVIVKITQISQLIAILLSLFAV